MSATFVIRCRLLLLLCLTLLSSGMLSPESRAESSLYKTVLDFLGVTVSPSALKGTSRVLEEGDIWLAYLESGLRTRLTWDGGYRSPVFIPESEDIVVLKGDDILRIPLSSEEPERLQTVPGIQKLVGFHSKDPDKALILLKDKAGLVVDVLSLGKGKITHVLYSKEDDQPMLNHLRDWERVYGGTRIYVETGGCDEREQEWTDVCLKREGKAPINISRCDGVSCGQPSLSLDGNRVVYVKAEK